MASVSDHYVIEAYTAFRSKFELHEEKKPEHISPLDKLNFFSNDIEWGKLNEDLKSIDWVNKLSNNPEDMLSKFMHEIHKACNKYVPRRKSLHKTGKPKIPRDRRIISEIFLLFLISI